LSSKKKILILVDWFAPGYKAGGPVQSCVNLCIALNKQYDIYVLTTDTDHGETKPYPEIESGKWLSNEELGVKICYLEKQTLTAKKLKAEMEFINADIVYLNHLFSPYFVVYPLWLKLTGAIKSKLVVCPRGALYDSALSLKQYKKQPLLLVYKWLGIKKKVIFHATNDREKAAIEKYFPGSSIVIADNLPSLKQKKLKNIYKDSGILNCIFISRIVPIKNLLFLLKAMNKVTGKINLTITGPVEDLQYWEQCKKEISKLPANITTNYTGAQPNEVLASLLKENHLYISPTTGENFGHSIFEAFLSGRPVLISDQTPWLHLQEVHAGWDISLDKPAVFSNVISEVAAFNQQQYDEYARGAWMYADNYIKESAHKEEYKILFS
jgi:glycosyltransferase involved in cell wall biosynthesis